jgi:hypothetical protein
LYLAYDPLDIDFGYTAPNTVMGINCNGTTVDIGSRFYYDWSTTNPAIVTVDTYGTHRGNAVGSAASSAFGYLPTPAGLKCPLQKQTVTGNDNVMPQITSITPSQGLVGTAVSVTINGTGFASGATVNAGSNISVSNVNMVSSTQITATFTPSNSTSAGGNQSVTVTVAQQKSNQ